MSKIIITLFTLLFLSPLAAQEFEYSKKLGKYVFKVKGVKAADRLQVDDYVNNFNGTWFVLKDDIWNIVDNKGTAYNEVKFTEIVDLQNGFLRVKSDGKYGVIESRSLMMVMDIAYDHIDYYTDQKAIFKKDGTWYQRENKTTKEITAPTIFHFPETPLVWRGCEGKNYACSWKEMMYAIYGNIRYPAEARENGIQGVVDCEVIIGKDGNLKEVTLLNSVEGGCDEEAIRVIKGNLSNWWPASHEGQTVEVRMLLAVKYRLE